LRVFKEEESFKDCVGSVSIPQQVLEKAATVVPKAFEVLGDD